MVSDARAARPPQPRSLIVTVYGAYARETGGWLSVALLVRLLAELGVEEPAVRSSVSRLKRRGLLVQQRRDTAVGYALSEQGWRILAAGDRRIFSPARSRLEDGWVLVCFSVPETERSLRHALRTQLTALGFGTVSPGVWIGPSRLADDVREQLDRLGLTAYADVFTGHHVSPVDLRERAARWWDLDALQAHYGAYVERWSPVLGGWRRRSSTDPARAFCDYVGTLTDWRRLPYLDPGLPSEVLPRRWQGSRAAEVFFALRDVLEQPAHEHVVDLSRAWSRLGWVPSWDVSAAPVRPGPVPRPLPAPGRGPRGPGRPPSHRP